MPNRTSFVLPVCARASRSARCVASVPDDTKRSFSALGTISLINSAHSKLHRVLRAVMRAPRDLARHGLDHRRVCMAENQRTVAAEVIDVLVTVDVPFVRARGVVDVERMRFEEPPVVRHAAGKSRERPLVMLGRRRRLVDVPLCDLRGYRLG